MSRQLRICDAPAPKRALWVRLLVGVAALGCTYQVHVFTVEPALVCPGQPVKVAWQVDGPTSLRAEPKPNGWDDGEVASQGTRTVTPTVPTEFTVAAIKANKAKGNSQATKSVQIAKAGPGAELGSNTTCDASGICTGSLQFDGGAGPFVKRISLPRVSRGGHVEAAQVCVSHPGLQRVCIQANGAIDVNAPADNEWKLDTTVTDRSAPPPQVRAEFEFGCP